MESEESGCSTPPLETETKKKNPRGKPHDLKNIKRKVPLYINLTKSSDPNDVRKGLIGMRCILLSGSDSDLIWNSLQSCSGMKHLVRLATACNDEKQLGMLLCIIHLTWNKITNVPFRVEVMNCGTMCHLGTILVKTICLHNQLRALKLIGALAQVQVRGKEFANTGVGKAIVAILAQSQSSNLSQTAVKTLRKLWSAEKSHVKLLDCQAVRTVAKYLDTKDKELLACVLKTLVIFTNPCTIPASQQIAGKGDGYHLIVNNVGKPIISELICNLSRSAVGRIELTRAGLVPVILQQIYAKQLDKHLIMALCEMCQESMVRASMRATPLGFETFLSLITNQNAVQYHSDLLYALTYFMFDTQSLTMMVGAGLVDVLVEKLSEFVASNGSEHYETPPIPEPDILIPSYSITSHVYASFSPTYSISSLESFNLPTALEISSFCGKKKKENDYNNSRSQDSCIIEVLLQLTYHHTKLKTLALRDTINTILRYMTTIDFSRQETNFCRATRTLRAIVSCKHHFNNLLDDKTVMSIHRELCLRKHWNCVYCEKLYEAGQAILNEMAECSESALGEGELSHRLISGTSPMKTNVALTIPLIIKQPKLLGTLLVMHRGLECLLNALESHIDDAVPALYSLMKTVGITDPKERALLHQCIEDDSDDSIEEEIGKEDVKFELDDGSSVSASKGRLARNYPMFEAMFRGGFKEADAATVRLPGVSAACLQALVGLDSSNPSPSMLPSSLTTLLEMVSASDRFLSPVLAENLISHIVQRVLSYETSPEIYSWSVNTGYKLPFSSTMAVTIVSYLFTANIFFKDRVKAVKQIINSPEKKNLFCDLNSIIVNGMQDYCERMCKSQPNFNQLYEPIRPSHRPSCISFV